MKPVTSIPSASPSITGAVATVSMSGSVTEAVAVDDVQELVSELAQIYGVSEDDVDVSVVGHVFETTADGFHVWSPHFADFDVLFSEDVIVDVAAQ